ncbi:MAG: hypothetical protein IJN76_02085 [Clostridia bacterium]|nr:hypothetical protein [Clostridia bacterium]
MADIKTHLRELSVATTVGVIANGKELHLSDMYNSRKFLQMASSVICNDISTANNLLDYPIFTGEMKTIVDNGFKLGKKILESREFHISKNPEIMWLGNDTQKGDPVDIVIDDYAFSLKEESFILKNMGLYTFLNNLTGSNYARGIHVFSTFALKEYDDWFAYTWNCFVRYLRSNKRWQLVSENTVSEAFLSGQNVVLRYNRITSTIPQNITTNRAFMKNTVAGTREKVFSKWINHEISDNAEYLRVKNKCSVTAGKKLCDTINSEFSPENVFEFFQIYPFEYYYAKTTPVETTILKVPAQADFKDVIEFKGCIYDVPSSQLNIISTFENINTGKKLQFRNECRFSHGQFNGTPEAKMYVVRNTPLTEIYEPIE